MMGPAITAGTVAAGGSAPTESPLCPTAGAIWLGAYGRIGSLVTAHEVEGLCVGIYGRNMVLLGRGRRRARLAGGGSKVGLLARVGAWVLGRGHECRIGSRRGSGLGCSMRRRRRVDEAADRGQGVGRVCRKAPRLEFRVGRARRQRGRVGQRDSMSRVKGGS